MQEQDTTFEYTTFDIVLIALVCAIVASMAIPTYAEYQAVVRFSEVQEVASDARRSIERVAADGVVDSLDSVNSGSHGIPEVVVQTAEQHGLVVMHGEITVIWKNDGSRLAGETYTLSANGMLPPVQWTVSGSCIRSALC